MPSTTSPTTDDGERRYHRRYIPLADRAVLEGHPCAPDLLFVDESFGAVIDIQRIYTVLLDDDRVVSLTQAEFEVARYAGRQERARLVRFFTELHNATRPGPAHGPN